MPLTIQQYSKKLTDIGIDHEIVDHPELKTPPEVQTYLGLTLADGLATMIMKTSDSFIIVIRRCDMRLDSKKMKKLVGNKLRIANAEEFTQITGLPIGTARVYVPGLPTYLDENLFQKAYLTSGSGSFICSVRVKSEDLKKLPNSHVVTISE
jgi:prolyl-tRNA editing enzyme YbaK/EbsC (Cys-tRNA(Pro) deacylase)